MDNFKFAFIVSLMTAGLLVPNNPVIGLMVVLYMLVYLRKRIEKSSQRIFLTIINVISLFECLYIVWGYLSFLHIFDK